MDPNKNKQFDFGLPYVTNHFKETMDGTVIELDKMLSVLKQQYEHLEQVFTSGDSKARSDFEQRHETLQFVMADLSEMGALVSSVIKGYSELSETATALANKDNGVQVAMELRQQLNGQVPQLNILFGEVNSYAYFLHDVLKLEIESFPTAEKSKETRDVMEIALERNYKALMEKRFVINKMLQERTISISQMITTLRKVMASLHVKDVELEVAERNELLKQYKTEEILEDIHDYGDLEGQFRHQYDEVGEVISDGALASEEEFQEYQANRVSYWLIGLVIIGIIFAGVAFYFSR